MRNSKHEAAIANPALKPFEVLIGEWKTVGVHPLVPGTIFHGHTSFKWMESGAFISMHSEIDEEGIPSGIAVFGSDDATGKYFMLYFDERKVSRKYDIFFNADTLNWRRDSPGFSQRLTMTISDDGNVIISNGELSRDNMTWEKDLELTFNRIK